MIRIWLHRLQTELELTPVSELFIRVIYLVLLWSVGKMLPIGDVIWGSSYFIELFNPYTGIDQYAMLLNDPSIRAYWPWLVWPFLTLLLLGIGGIHNFFTRAVVAYLFVLIHFGNFEVSSGGHHLMQQILFFHVLMIRVDTSDSSRKASMFRLIHHLGFYAIWVNISLLYLVAGITKLQGETWLSGEAVTLALSFEAYSFPFVADHLSRHYWFMTTITILTLTYQLAFPFLIWWRAIRRYLLVVGVIFHLSIAFVVGLADFGLMLIAAYAIFINKNRAAKVLAFLPRSFQFGITRAYPPS